MANVCFRATCSMTAPGRLLPVNIPASAPLD